MTPSNAWSWVGRVGALYALVGSSFVLASFSYPLLGRIDGVLVPDHVPPTPSVRMYAAVMGAVVLGFGVMISRVSGGVAQGSLGVARGLRDGLLAWFVVDTLASLLHGSWQNALFNVVSLALGLPPVVLAARASVRTWDRT